MLSVEKSFLYEVTGKAVTLLKCRLRATYIQKMLTKFPSQMADFISVYLTAVEYAPYQSLSACLAG